MAAENVIRSKLINNATVASLVSTRVRPSIAKANETLPYVAFEQIASNRWQNADGYTGMAQITYEFRCYATTRAGASALVKAVRIALDHKAAAGTVSGQTIQVVTALDGDEDIEFRGKDSQTPVYVSSIDMEVYTTEAVS